MHLTSWVGVSIYGVSLLPQSFDQCGDRVELCIIEIFHILGNCVYLAWVGGIQIEECTYCDAKIFTNYRIYR